MWWHDKRQRGYVIIFDWNSLPPPTNHPSRHSAREEIHAPAMIGICFRHPHPRMEHEIPGKVQPVYDEAAAQVQVRAAENNGRTKKASSGSGKQKKKQEETI